MRITTPNDLGALIQGRREAIALKQGDLACEAGVDQGNIAKIERGNETALPPLRPNLDCARPWASISWKSRAHKNGCLDRRAGHA